MTTYIPSITLPAVVFDNPAYSILIPVALGSAVGQVVRPTVTKETYKKLKQAPLNPPSYVFPIVWMALYGGMGYAAFRAWTTGMSSLDPQKVILAKHGATLYTIQLGLNLIWTPLFFGLLRPIEATADILALLGTTGYLTYTWSKVDEVSAWIMVPYLAWLSFATYLCAGCGYLNNWDFKAALAKADKEA